MSVDPQINQSNFDAAIQLAWDNPAAWFKQLHNVTLDLWQIELLESILDVHRFLMGTPTVTNHYGKNKITVRAMHGPGKSFGIACAMHLFNFIYLGRIVATAPTLKQVKTRLWPAFRKVNAGSLDYYKQLIKIDATKITWAGNPDWVALAETATQPDNLAGYHDDYMLFLVDEASGVNEALFPVIEGALSTGIIVIFIMIGNPTKNLGTFADSHLRESVSKHYYRMHVSLDKTTRVSRDWVNQMIEKYGENSPVVQVRCKGNFADTDDDQLIPLSWIDNARKDSYEPDGSIPRLRISTDVADGGEDDTVITVAKIYDSFTVILKKYSYNFPSSEAPILSGEATIQIADDWGYDIENGDVVIIDSLGVGAGTAGYVIKTNRFNVITYKGGEKSDDVTQWRNRRTQSYICYRNAFRDGELIILNSVFDDPNDWEDYTAQICSIKSKPGAERVEDLITKKEMKAQSIKSPDLADSDAMLFATQKPRLGNKATLEITTVGQSMAASYDGSITQ